MTDRADEREGLLGGRAAAAAAAPSSSPLLPPVEPCAPAEPGWHRPPWLRRWRRQSQRYLESKEKHYLILALVSVDVAAILAEILVSLVACDLDAAGEDLPWLERVVDVSKMCGLVISSLFLVELLASVWAFGFGFFASWFHCFDAFVILVSFVVDVLAHGVLEEIASLVVVLRLWRMVKIVEEMSVGASEQMEELEAQVGALELETQALHRRNAALEQQNRMLIRRLDAHGLRGLPDADGPLLPVDAAGRRGGMP